jgi:hypothetical protein
MTRTGSSITRAATMFLLLFVANVSTAYAGCGLFSGCISTQYCSTPADPFNGGTCKNRVSAGSSCSLLIPKNCKSGLVCDAISECRHSPPLAGEPCGTGVSCASGLKCSSPIGGRCQAPRTAGQSCLGFGQANCASGLVCDVLQECRHSPPLAGEPCGTGVSCAGDLVCSDIAAGRCQQRGGSTDPCFGIGQGNCQAGLVCDALLECRNQPPQLGERCGTGVPCASGLGCSAEVGGRCQTLGDSGDACSGFGQGSCKDGLVCDVLRQCRHEIPQLGELCGLGVNCVAGLVCSDIAAGQCQRRSGSTEPCWGIGQGTCQDGFVCDALLECRKQPPQRGELCGRGVSCAQGLACSKDIAGRCETPKVVRETCQGLGQGNCVDHTSCMLTRDRDSGDLGFRCYPQGESAIPKDTCLTFYSPALHQESRNLRSALTFGTATGAGAGASTSVEIGTVYGPDGQYGCYDTLCAGALSNASATPLALCAGLYNSYDNVVGDSVTSVESVSPIPAKPVSYSTAQIFPQLGSFNLIGTADCLSAGVGVLPLDVGVYQCTTNVATYQQDSNNDGVIDFKAVELGLDVTLPSGDSDGDGIRDIDELGGDINNPLDSDGDGVIDALEAGNAAIDARFANGLKLPGGGSINIATAPGKLLSGMSVIVAAETAPDGVSFPFGVLSYNTTSDPGASVEITVAVTSVLPANMSLYKVDHLGNYMQLPDTIWQQTDEHSLKLTLTDGDPMTDLDGVVDGVIEDPLAIGSVTTSNNIDSSSNDSSGGGGGRFDPNLLLLVPLLLIACRYYRRLLPPLIRIR